MAETMVLRFRDLVAQTIASHQKIIDASGYVWWGWWNKPEERVPRDAFAAFSETIERSGSLGIFLVDSGTQRLYRATLQEIAASPTEREIACPDPAHTPQYYRTFSYKAWFRLGSIEEADAAELRSWSYAEVLQFIADPTADRFNGKRVFDAGEMLARSHRTIYFLEPYQKDAHRDYRVELVSPLPPANFSTTPLFTRSHYIVQLSDVHFGRGHHAFSVDAAGGPVQQSLAAAIIADLNRQYPGVPPAAVILSGDLTWQGTAEEYAWALELVQTLRSAFDLSPHQFLSVPGNHDVQWAEQEPGQYDRTRPVTAASDAATRNYRDFYLGMVGIVPEGQLCMGRRIVLRNFVSLDLVALNSSLLEQKQLAGFGFVSLPQLEHAAEAMEWSGEERGTRYRILVLHHHLVPVTALEEIEYGRTYSLTLDAAQVVTAAMQKGVDLVLHGHMHQPFAGSVARAGSDTGFTARRTLAIHGAGSAGVRRDHTGAIGKNSYSVLEFDDAGATLHVRSTSENVAGFAKDWSCRLETNPAGGFLLADVPA